MYRTDSQAATPWWRVPAMWLVVLGPALAVAGSFASLAFALHGGDRPLAEAAEAQRSASTVPAQQARNHAATQPR